MTYPTFGSRASIAFVTALIALCGAEIAEAQRWGRTTAPRAGACFYRDANVQGDYFCASAGQDISQVPEPDPGSQAYVDRVLRDKWSEQDVIRELRRSDGFRNRNR